MQILLSILLTTFLRLPQQTDSVSAVLYCHQNMTEEVLFRSPYFTAEMDRLGVTRLDNRAVFFRGVWIGGLSSAQYLAKKEPDLAFLSSFSQKTGFKLLLSHHPEYYPKYIRQQPIDLTVSGHAHGGQWRFFGRGVYAPGQGLFPRYTKGLYEGRLLVSCGLKHSRIPRFFNPREILLLTVGETKPRVSE